MKHKDEVFTCRSKFSPRVGVGVDASASDENGHGAVQSFREECNINNIMAKFQRTGVLEWESKYRGVYEDVSGIDFETSMASILRAQEMFGDLPSSVRDRFHNNPASFLDFIGDDRNRDEAVRLGLIVVSEPVVAPVK